MGAKPRVKRKTSGKKLRAETRCIERPVRIDEGWGVLPLAHETFMALVRGVTNNGTRHYPASLVVPGYSCCMVVARKIKRLVVEDIDTRQLAIVRVDGREWQGRKASLSVSQAWLVDRRYRLEADERRAGHLTLAIRPNLPPRAEYVVARLTRQP